MLGCIFERMEILDSTDYYNQYAAKYYQDTVNLDLDEIKEEFINYLPDDGDILDIGCGSGRDSLYFIEKGYGVTSIESSSELAELASIHTGQQVINMSYSKINFEKVFDGIWTCATLSRSTEEEVKLILRNSYKSLKKNGILFISVYSGSYQGIKENFYYKEYRAKELKRRVEEIVGFKVLHSYKSIDVRRDSNKKWLHIIIKKEK